MVSINVAGRLRVAATNIVLDVTAHEFVDLHTLLNEDMDNVHFMTARQSKGMSRRRLSTQIRQRARLSANF